MKAIINVDTGDVKAADKGYMLVCGAIGSCVAVLAYDTDGKIAGMAHIMLPGKAPKKFLQESTRYAYNAINMLFKKMAMSGAGKKNIKLAVLGGCNVLKDENDSIGKANIKSVFELLAEKKMNICKKAVGGTERMSLQFDIEKGFLQYTQGDGAEKFWKY